MDSGLLELESNLPAATTVKGDHSIPGKKSSSSSSSASSSSLYEDPIELGTNETNKSTAGDTTGQHDKDTKLASPCSEEDIPVSSMPGHEQHTSDGAAAAATQFPGAQVMERADDSAPPTSAYRIPSSVFARTISTAPVEWSTASNESLFSIHMGNMSFTRDQLYYMGKSGDLGLSGEYSMPGSSLEYSSYNQPPSNKSSTEIGKKSGNLNGGFGVTETAAAETMRQVIRENEDHCSHSRNSDEGSSVKSFAFPILTGNGHHKSFSMKRSKEKRKQQPQSQPETPRVTLQSQPQTPKSTSHTPKVTANAARCKWLSCFYCC